MDLGGKLNSVIIFSVFCIILSACQGEREVLNGLVIEGSSVEFGSLQNPDDKNLHFRVNIIDYGLKRELEYKVRFLIQNTALRDWIGMEEIDVPETYKTQPFPNDGARGIVTGSSVEINKEFSIDEIRKTIEKKEAVIVEIYDKDQTIAREVVTTFVENIQPLVKFNPQAKMETIVLNEANEVELFIKAVNDSVKEQGIAFIEHPKYKFDLDGERYFLWVTEDTGRMMNTKDTYTIYSLSDSSLKEIQEFINKD